MREIVQIYNVETITGKNYSYINMDIIVFNIIANALRNIDVLIDIAYKVRPSNHLNVTKVPMINNNLISAFCLIWVIYIITVIT